MVPRVNASQQLLDSLRSSDSNTRLKAVRQLKNTVIGDKFQKQLYCHLDCVPALLELASSSNDPELVVQALAAIGSLAYGVEDGVKAIAACNGIAKMIAALCSNDQRVVVAAARALKLVNKSPLAPHEALLQGTVLQRLVSLLQQPQHANVAEAAAKLLAQCCTDASKASTVVAAGAVPALVQLLSSDRRSYQEAAVECLEAVTQYSPEACQQLLQLGSADNGYSTTQQQQQQQATSVSVQQLHAGPASPSALAAAVQLPCKERQTTGHVHDAGVLAGQQPAQLPVVVLQLLQLMKQHDSRLRFLCASCLVNLSRGCPAAEGTWPELKPACLSVLPRLVRLLAAAEAAATAAGDAHHGSYTTGSPAYRAMLGLDAAPDKHYLLKVPSVLAALVANRQELLKLAFDLDAVKLLLRLVTSKAAAATLETASSSSAATQPVAGQAGSSCSSSGPVGTSGTKARARAAAEAAAAKPAAAAAVELRIGCLTALGTLARLSDPVRQQMVTEQNGKLIPLVVTALSDSNAKVQAAAAVCLKGLSRSVSLLRSGNIPAAVAEPLVLLLQDSNATDAQVAAAGAVCNLLLHFSSVRKALLKAGALQALLPLTCSMIPDVRQHACWALKHLAHECDAAEQAALLAELSYDRFRVLLVADDDDKVREQSVGLLQNLCKGGASIEQLMAWSKGDLLPLLEEQLSLHHFAALAAAVSTGNDTRAAEQQHLKTRLVGLLYATANVCSGYSCHQAAVMNSKLPVLLLQHLQGSSSSWLHEVRLAAVWCVINLLWNDAATATAAGGAGSSSGAGATAAGTTSSAETVASHIEKLKKLGFEDALKSLLAQCTGACTSTAPSTEAGTSTTGASAAGSSRAGTVLPLPPPLPAARDMCGQDLAERVQTALEQLGAK